MGGVEFLSSEGRPPVTLGAIRQDRVEQIRGLTPGRIAIRLDHHDDQKGALMPDETAQQAYQRGRTETRLDHHDEQIAANRALIGRTVDISASLSSTVQTLSEARVSDAAARVATAKAVKEARDTQEDQLRAAWSPVAKVVTVLGSIGVLVGILSSLPLTGG